MHSCEEVRKSVSQLPNILSLVQLWTQRSDPVLHIELRRWADLLIIAPLDANTLGKIASGICDNLLVRICRRKGDGLYSFYNVGKSFSYFIKVDFFSPPDVCGKSLGHQSTSSLLPCYEYSYVAASHYSPAGVQAQRIWIC